MSTLIDLHDALAELGFFGRPEGDDEWDEDAGINGGDCVDVIDQHLDAIRTIPALVRLQQAVGALVKAGGYFKSEVEYQALVAIYKETLK